MHIFHKWNNWEDDSRERGEDSCVVPPREEMRTCDICNKTQVRRFAPASYLHIFKAITQEQADSLKLPRVFDETSSFHSGESTFKYQWFICQRCGVLKKKSVKNEVY